MKHVKYVLSATCLIFINVLFTYKYSLRVTDWALPLSAAVLVLQYSFFHFREHLQIDRQRFAVLACGACAVLLVFTAVSSAAVQPESLNVDRWSVISSFLDAAFIGNYPYQAVSHLGNYPGPMPFYFLIALPFYWINKLSFLSAAGYIVFTFLIVKRGLQGYRIPLLLFLLSSAFTYWEIVTRSNIFTNAVLIVCLLYALDGFDYTFGRKFVLYALLTGFLLSTRSIFVLVYILYFLAVLIQREATLKQMTFFTFVAMAGFAATFAPFVLLYEEFFTMNPFMIQSLLIPKGYILLFVAISIGMAFMVKEPGDRYLYSGLALFLTIAAYFSYQIAVHGYHPAYLGSQADISYFLFCAPFFMMHFMSGRKDTGERKQGA